MIFIEKMIFMNSDIIIALISGLCIAIPNLVAILASGYHNSKNIMKRKM